jgi:hypothetical protein
MKADRPLDLFELFICYGTSPIGGQRLIIEDG